MAVAPQEARELCSKDVSSSFAWRGSTEGRERDEMTSWLDEGEWRPDLLKDLLASSTSFIARQLAVSREEGVDSRTSTPGYSGLGLIGDFNVAEIIFHVPLL